MMLCADAWVTFKVVEEVKFPKVAVTAQFPAFAAVYMSPVQEPPALESMFQTVEAVTSQGFP